MEYIDNFIGVVAVLLGFHRQPPRQEAHLPGLQGRHLRSVSCLGQSGVTVCVTVCFSVQLSYLDHEVITYIWNACRFRWVRLGCVKIYTSLCMLKILHDCKNLKFEKTCQ